MKIIKNKFNWGAHIILVAFSVLVLIPVLWMVSTSIKIEAETILMKPKWIPDTPTLEAYRRLWVEYPFLSYLRNSLCVVLVAVTISVAFSCLVGYGVTRFQFRGKANFITFLLITQMFPSVMLLVPYYKVLSTYGLTDTLVGLMLIHISFTIPFCSWMMIGFFRTIPEEIDEAAIIDGCTRFQAFRKIVLPLTLPGIASSAVYAFITSWNEYMFAQTMITSPEMKTIPVGIGELNGFYKILWNDMMAASVIASLPLLIGFIFLQRYFISGLTAGAVKL